MQLAWLTPLIGTDGPFATVYLTSQDGLGLDGGSRWHILRRSLQDKGATGEVLELLDERSRQHLPGHSGPGRVIIASATGTHIDRPVAMAPVCDEVSWDEVPSLAPAIRAAELDVRFVLVTVDRTGADLEWFDPEEFEGTGKHTEHIASGHDVINKTTLRGRAFAKITARAEDSWERNADLVAAEVDKFLRHHRGELVILAGDIRTRAMVRARLHLPDRIPLREMQGGARGGKVNKSSLGTELATLLTEHRTARRAEVAQRFAARSATERDAISGLGAVLNALSQGQVDELVITGPRLVMLGTEQVLTGTHPLELARDAAAGGDTATLEVTGSQYQVIRGDVAVIRAAVHQDARLSVVEEEDVHLEDGIGAILRWPQTAIGSTEGASQYELVKTS